ncbi:MAG: V-type ATP synthase subunit F [Anaerolineales bacterium]|nr:V-type ATP synthase subunit F [Anaerolineales bacterium]
MSRLLIVTQPALLPGFHLAGVEAYGAASSEAAQRLIAGWIEAGQAGLLGVDETLLAGFTPAFRRRLEAAAQLPCLAIPAGQAGQAGRLRQEMAELIRRTVGFHITFRGGET